MKSKLTNTIEFELLKYFREFKHIPVCNEVKLSQGICDIFAINIKKRLSYEIEIKISKADLQNELKHKNKKHKFYKSGREAKNKPNYFYFCVPKVLKKDAKNFILKVNKNYGLLIYENNQISLCSKPKKLCNKLNDKLIEKLLKRSTSAYYYLRRNYETN